MDNRGILFRLRTGKIFCVSSKVSRLALEPTLRRVRWAPGTFFSSSKVAGLTGVGIPPYPHMPSYRAQG